MSKVIFYSKKIIIFLLSKLWKKCLYLWIKNILGNISRKILIKIMNGLVIREQNSNCQISPSTPVIKYHSRKSFFRKTVNLPMHSCLGLFEKFHTVKSILALSTSSNSMSENTCFVAQTGLCEADSTSVENVRLHLEFC